MCNKTVIFPATSDLPHSVRGWIHLPKVTVAAETGLLQEALQDAQVAPEGGLGDVELLIGSTGSTGQHVDVFFFAMG